MATADAVERELRERIVAKEGEIKHVQEQLQNTAADREKELLLLQQLPALQQLLLLLMQQQAGAAGLHTWHKQALTLCTAC